MSVFTERESEGGRARETKAQTKKEAKKREKTQSIAKKGKGQQTDKKENGKAKRKSLFRAQTSTRVRSERENDRAYVREERYNALVSFLTPERDARNGVFYFCVVVSFLVFFF